MAVSTRPVESGSPGPYPPSPRPLVIRDRQDERVRVYTWEVPVRVTHWWTFSTVVILSITGGYIADPFIIPPGGSIMTVMRFIHMVAALNFVASGVLRTYWLFAGNRFARWTAFIPTNKRQATEAFRQIGWYAFLRKEAPRVLGHNALAAGTYFVVFFLFLIQTASGFALAGVHGAEPWATLFGWVPGLLGGLQGVRLIHHLLMWAVIGFACHHVYSALLVDHWERTGILGSIFSGYKFVTRKEIDEARDGGMKIQEISE